ncbi:alpha/beta hydrolase [Carboxylicivirga sp. M1479]|uniref:alpha/beta hydrolase n=1 Tax=Carboxylicivirga sp. M1479 TaxID=2594476 RepID=UPI001178370E|nr:alpha/beta hydrolase [Carboxylicivirga sp. M1479]TRX66552.1 alpha/beta hydrolase [Carboxylicivirga sp. M1479]
MKQLIGVLVFLSVLTNGISQQYTKSKQVVFIHGAWSTGAVWDNYCNYFTNKGYECLLPDLKYHSNVKNKGLAGLSMEDYIAQIRDLLKEYEQAPVLVAHSMGCIVAQRLATEGLVSQMVLLAPPVNYGMIPPPKSIQSVKWLNKESNLKSSLVKPTFEQAQQSLLYTLPVEVQKQIYADLSYESGLVMKEMIWIKNVFGPKPNKINYGRVNIPVLIIAGEKDLASPPQISKKLAKKYKPQSTLKVYAGKAHWIMGDSKWEEVAEYITMWLP